MNEKKKVIDAEFEKIGADGKKVKQKKDKIIGKKIYVAGYFSKGEKKGKKISFVVQDKINLNPVAPIFDAHPDIDCLVVSRDEQKAKKNFDILVKSITQK